MSDTQAVPAVATPEPTTLITIGDILKSEADRHSRENITADNIKIGQLVQHPIRKKYLVALSNTNASGLVLVQPHNCVINLAVIKEADIKAAAASVEKFIKEGDEYGIKYIGKPIADTASSGVGV
ncbi:hypothetical protein [Moraxella bovis]|uniref:hypothetical protein n=1 Tax=Moraxella bovis TaxID=476 RepID=UPI0009929670|nr:hypothetical protein [Moraxella bovis]OOR87927.1 hypothetical protein B0182_10905 [Moraxella bovis]UZA23869.1 hypothetical protein LP117_08745 [Moraxella bovis]UZA30122.1 hypothetical protein LP097_00150 [Moraxella bovis]